MEGERVFGMRALLILTDDQIQPHETVETFIKRGREDFTRALISIDELERKLQLTPTPDPAPASAGGCGDPE